MAEEAECCFVVGDNGEGCGRTPAWSINYGPRPDDYTDACDEHVGELLVEGVINTVYPFADGA